MWAASVRGKFFKRLDHPSVLPRVLGAAADVREGQRRQQVGDRTLTVGHAKALFDHPFEIDPTPPNHAVYHWIGAGLDDYRQRAHLLIA